MTTNLQPFFGICGATVKNIIRRNKKGALIKFLFGISSSDQSQTYQTTEFQGLKEMEKKIQGFQNEVNSLKQKLRKLENKKKI